MGLKRRAIEKRRDTVASLVITGWTHAKIADVMNMSKLMVERDIKAVKDKYKDDLLRSSEELIARLNMNADKRIRLLWGIISDKGCSRKEKIVALQQLRKEDREFMKRAQCIGLLPYLKEKVDIIGSEGKLEGDKVYGILLEIQKEHIQVQKDLKDREVIEVEGKDVSE